MVQVRRRHFLIATGALLAASLARAQPTTKRARVVLLSDYLYGRWPVELDVAFRETLRDRMVAEIQAAAHKLEVKPHYFEIASSEPPDRIDMAFETMVREGVGAVLGLQGPHFYRERERIALLSLRHRLPGIFDAGESVETGALMTYDPDFVDLTRRGAAYVDRILKGAKPSELPVEQPNRFVLAINLRTAAAMRVTFPRSVLLRADRVID